MTRSLSVKIRRMDQILMSNRVVISGIPETKGEDTTKVVEALFGKLNVQQKAMNSTRMGPV